MRACRGLYLPLMPLNGILAKGVELKIEDKVEILKDRCRGMIIDFFNIGNKKIRVIIESTKGDTYSFDSNQYGSEFVLASKSNQDQKTA